MDQKLKKLIQNYQKLHHLLVPNPLTSKRDLIYLTDSPAISLTALELLYRTQELQSTTFFLNAIEVEVEKNLLEMQSYLLNQNCVITINNSNWKNKESFKSTFQSLLNSYKNKNLTIMVEANSQKMFHTHFIYKDLLTEIDVIVTIFSKTKNLIWTYSPKRLKWIETSLNQKGLCFAHLETALRNSHKEETTERFEHTIRVVKTAWEIMSNLSSMQEWMKIRILVACAYHDFAKNWKLENLQPSFLKKHPELKDCPSWALHGPIAAYYLKIRGLIKNPSILKAIKCHTLPPKKLGVVGKIVVIADKLEPFKENNFPGTVFRDLWSQIKKGNYEYVYEYLRLNPNKKG